MRAARQSSRRAVPGGALPWRFVLDITCVLVAIAIAAGWLARSAAVGAMVLAGIPLIAGILTLARQRQRAQVARALTELARWGETDAPARISFAGATDLAPLAPELNDAALRWRERMRRLAARQSEADAILQSMTSGVIALDPDHRIFRANLAAERLLRIEPE